MRTYVGTNHDDTVTGAQDDENFFDKFGLGSDTLTGGHFDDTFLLLADTHTDFIYGNGGEDTIDYRFSDRGLTIDLAHDEVSAVFNGSTVDVARVYGIEDVRGSGHDDVITGNPCSCA